MEIKNKPCIFVSLVHRKPRVLSQNGKHLQLNYTIMIQFKRFTLQMFHDFYKSGKQQIKNDILDVIKNSIITINLHEKIARMLVVKSYIDAYRFETAKIYVLHYQEKYDNYDDFIEALIFNLTLDGFLKKETLEDIGYSITTSTAY